jgi:hypothetical protein
MRQIQEISLNFSTAISQANQALLVGLAGKSNNSSIVSAIYILTNTLLTGETVKGRKKMESQGGIQQKNTEQWVSVEQVARHLDVKPDTAPTFPQETGFAVPSRARLTIELNLVHTQWIYTFYYGPITHLLLLSTCPRGHAVTLGFVD